MLSVPNVSFNILVFNKSWTGDVAKDNKIVEPKLKNKKHKGVCWWPLERSKMHFAILLINFHHCCNTSIRNKWVSDCLGNILYNKYFQCFYTHISVKLMSLTLLMSSWIKPMQRNNLDNSGFLIHVWEELTVKRIFVGENELSSILLMKVHWFEEGHKRVYRHILFHFSWNDEWQVILTNTMTSHKCDSFCLSFSSLFDPHAQYQTAGTQFTHSNCTDHIVSTFLIPLPCVSRALRLLQYN